MSILSALSRERRPVADRPLRRHGAHGRQRSSITEALGEYTVGGGISSANEQMEGMLMLRSSSWHGGLAAEMMARASSGTGTL